MEMFSNHLPPKPSPPRNEAFDKELSGAVVSVLIVVVGQDCRGIFSEVILNCMLIDL